MRQLLLLVLALLGVVSLGAAQELQSDYATAGSEDIYLSTNDEELPEQSQYENNYEEEQEFEEDEFVELQPQGINIDGIGETDVSCEYSCPRYYRPICVQRNDQQITYATPCEYHNELRCAHVLNRLQDSPMPNFQFLYHSVCEKNI
ncbi:uncharacterized protein LOC108605126 [Drosophila busckii]|uniref:uncharacterized protein LOC108605126 n=1 Tax=Drosophila busckii TaxID=30019 RepID=UPI00083F3D4B|nr:uncharacterized protein LOC108605126 [Drosophila busckii]